MLPVLIVGLFSYLEEEERPAFPLIEQFVMTADFEMVERAAKRAMGHKDAAWFFP